MSAIWTYSAIIQEQNGDHEVTFNAKQELEEYIGTCNKQVLFTKSNVEDNSPHRESTIF